MVLTNFLFYFVLCLTAKALLPPGLLLLMLLVQMVGGTILYIGADRLYFLLYPARDSAIVCSISGDEAGLLAKIGTIKERYKICCVCSEAECYDAILRKIDRYSTLFIGNINDKLRMELMDYCFEKGKRLLVTPTIEDIIFHNAHETFIGDSLVYLCRNRTFGLEQLIIKRLMDVFVSLVGVILTSPIMLITAIVIKLQDGGPVLFQAGALHQEPRAVHAVQVPQHGGGRRKGGRALYHAQRQAHHAVRALSSAARASTSCRSFSTSSRVKCRWSAARRAHRKRGLLL